MNIMDTNIENLNAELDGMVKLLEITVQDMDRECCGRIALADPNSALDFLDMTRNYYMSCLNQLLTRFEAIESGIQAEINRAAIQRKTA